MKEIKLTHGYVALVNDEECEFLSRFSWRAHEDKKTGTVYALATMSMHRLIMRPSKSETIDHKDGNGLNNQKSNLRPCSKSQNAQNMKARKTGTSIFKGVSWDAPNLKWRTGIKVNHRQVILGWYSTEIDAARAYDAAAVYYFGEFARLNFPDKRAEIEGRFHPRQARKQSRGNCKYRGVGKTGNISRPYRAHICVNGQRRHVGVYATEEEAARARDAAMLATFGNAASLNFPEPEKNPPF